MGTDGSIIVCCSDGGLKGGFIAGAITELYENHEDLWERVEGFTASSGSVASTMYVLSHGTQNRGEKIWTEDIPNGKFIDILAPLRNRPLYNVDRLVDIIFKENNPFRISNIRDSKYFLYFPLYDAEMGCNRHFILQNYGAARKELANGENVKYFEWESSDELYDIVRACCAIPLLYGESIRINGRQFSDGGALDPYIIEPEMELAGNKILITTKYEDRFIAYIKYSVLGIMVLIVFGLFKDLRWRRKVIGVIKKPWRLRALKKSAERLVGEGTLLVVQPKGRLSGYFSGSKRALKRNFEEGRRAMRIAIEEASEGSFYRDGRSDL